MEYMPFVKLLNHASVAQQMAMPGIVPAQANRPSEYIQLECIALREAFRAVEEFPGDELDVWGVMAEVFGAMNAELRAAGAHELMLVDYGTFLALIEAGSDLHDA